jgi:hypothetical protein
MERNEAYEYDAYDNDAYGDRSRPWRRRTSPTPTPSNRFGGGGDYVTRPELDATRSELSKEISTQTDAVNQRVTDALNNVKKEAVGTKKSVKNAQMMALFPMLMQQKQQFQFTRKTIPADPTSNIPEHRQEIVYLTDAQEKGSGNDNGSMLLVLMMMMMMGDGGQEGGDNSMMLMLVLVMMMQQQNKSGDRSLVVQAN